MCHASVLQFTASAITRADVEGLHVAEAGAYDVNGSPRPHVTGLSPASYTGFDSRPGPGVDVVADAADLPRYGPFSLVVSTEMLEHAPDWQAATRGMITALAPGGVLVLTTRSPGFGLHEYPGDYWRFPVDVMRAILAGAGLAVERIEPDPGAPGVCARARKPAAWSWPAPDPWAGISLPGPG